MSKENDHRLSESLLEAVRSTSQIVALTGAGISAESGIPTFREAQQGLWAQYDPQELATPEAFQDHPRRVLGWYRWRRDLIRRAQPNPGHQALAVLERKIQARGGQFTLITQNVDSLHQRAGNQQVIELHGNIFRSRCADCHQVHPAEFPRQDQSGDLPRCPSCNGTIRPDVVWFGEGLPQSALQEAIARTSSCTLFLSIGTSTVVQPAASLPFMAHDRGALTVEINPHNTPFSPTADLILQEQAGQLLPRLLEQAWPET